MKVQVLAVALAMTALLSACGDKHEKVYAVDKTKEAEVAAMAKAPKAEEVKFDDHGQPTFAEMSGATTTATTDAAPADATATATADAATTTTADATPATTDTAAAGK